MNHAEKIEQEWYDHRTSLPPSRLSLQLADLVELMRQALDD